LNVSGQELEDVLNLTLEATGEHLVSLVQDEELEVISLEEASLHHVVHTSWGTHDDVLALLEDTDVLTHDCASNASVYLDTKVLTDGVNHKGGLHDELTDGSNDQGLCVVAGGVDALQRSNSESASLSSSGLRLCDGVLRLDDWQDSLLLDGRRFLETKGIDASKDFFLQSHVVKIINFQVPVRFEKFFSFLS